MNLDVLAFNSYMKGSRCPREGLIKLILNFLAINKSYNLAIATL